MKQKPRLPRLPLKFFQWYCDPQMLDYIEGDLLEMYQRRLKSGGKRKADLLFTIDVLLLFRPGIIRSMSEPQPINPYGMIKNYFKTAWRNLWRNKLYSVINISGLTFGITCFILIGLYVNDEMTFDLQHENVQRIYRVIEHRSVNGNATVTAAASFKLAEESKNAIPEVENSTRLGRWGRANLVDPGNPVYFQETLTVADENFLKIFDFPLIAGDRQTALREPNSIVITEDVAMRIFNTKDVIGKNLMFAFPDPLKITGILKNHPQNSSFTFTSLVSESTFYKEEYFKKEVLVDWSSNSFSVYVLLQPDAKAESVSHKMTSLALSNFSPEPGTTLSYDLQPLTAVHLHSAGIIDGARNSNVEATTQGDPMYVTLFSFTALFVLLIAAINYTNLTTARASNRLKEIGVRKTLGAVRKSLLSQFQIESMMTIVISFLLAIAMVVLILPSFNMFVGKNLSLGISIGYRFWLLIIAFVLLMGFLSGSYGAFMLSRIKPISLLKGLKIQTRCDLSIRKALVITQFAISTVMIIGTIVLFLQVDYLNNASLGFNKDLMVVIDVNVQKARTNFETLKTEMSKIPSVKNVSVTSRVPGEWKTLRRIKVRNQGSTDDYLVTYMIGADRDFMDTYEVALVSGRNFNSESDSSSIIVNETAARMLGITVPSEQVIEVGGASDGGQFAPVNLNGKPFLPRVIGIVKDFHFQSLRDKIEPLILAYNNNPIQVIDYYSVKIEPTNIPVTLAKLKEVMVKNDEREPFEYHFLDEQLALFYVEDERRQSLLNWVALSSIFIACLGLFGLATYSSEQRVKEIGVRKVLGASVVNLVALLSRDFIRLVLIANAIAFPIAWWGTREWLREYAYHIEVQWWVYGAAVSMAVLIALVTISYQAIRASLANPVKSLRSE